MEKTTEEIRSAVMAYCEKVCPQSTKGFWHSISASIKLLHHPSESHRWSLDFFDGDGTNEWLCVLCWIGEDSSTEEMNEAYRLLGLDKRDALEAERAFWTASTDSLTKSLEAEKVKNANGGEFKNMLQQVLNHSNRPEMDDAQFRMFARENINHLLYGNKEGKKDE